MNTTIVQMYLHYPSLEVRHKVKFVVITGLLALTVCPLPFDDVS